MLLYQPLLMLRARPGRRQWKNVRAARASGNELATTQRRLLRLGFAGAPSLCVETFSEAGTTAHLRLEDGAEEIEGAEASSK